MYRNSYQGYGNGYQGSWNNCGGQSYQGDRQVYSQPYGQFNSRNQFNTGRSYPQPPPQALPAARQPLMITNRSARSNGPTDQAMAPWKAANNRAYHTDADEEESHDEYTDFQAWADDQWAYWHSQGTTDK